MKNDRSSSSALRGMALTDFSIGSKFVSGGYFWLCTDVGTRTVNALRMGLTEVSNASPVTGQEDVGRHDSSHSAYGERVFDEGDFSECTPAALHPDIGPDESLERVKALTDVLGFQLAQRIGVEVESAILIALVGYLRPLGNRETVTQHITRVQALARAAGIGPCLTDHKELMDDMWGES